MKYSVTDPSPSYSSYLTAQKKALAHVGNPDHKTWLLVVIGYYGMLAETHRLPTFLWPSDLIESVRKRESFKGVLPSALTVSNAANYCAFDPIYTLKSM